MKRQILAIFLISFLYIASGSMLRMEFQDDGAASFGAMRVLSGEMPYRDFMSAYTPAHYYVLAALFKVFGPGLIVERLWQSLIWAGVVSLVFCIVSLFSKARFGWLSAVTALGMIGRFPHVPGPMPSALFFSLGAAAACLRGLSSPDRRYPFLAGLSAAMAALYRQDYGGYAFLSIFSMLALCHDPDKRRKGDVRRFLGGFTALFVPPALIFLTAAGFHKLWEGLVYFPLKIYPSQHRLAYPPLEITKIFSDWTFFFYFTPLVCLLSAVFLMAGWHKPYEASQSRRFWPKLLMTTLACLLMSRAKFRPDPVHLLPAFVAAAILFGWMTASVFERPKRRWAGWAALILLVVYLAPGYAVRTPKMIANAAPAELQVPRARFIDVAPFNEADGWEWVDYEDVVKYLIQNSDPGEKIFVGSIRHDRVCHGDPLFYFLTGLNSATRHHELIRGVVTTDTAQQEIISELEKGPVRRVVLRKKLDDLCVEPNESSKIAGSKRLDQYLARRYRLEKAFGGNQVLIRNTDAAEAG